jgi:hypothetical protein
MLLQIVGIKIVAYKFGLTSSGVRYILSFMTLYPVDLDIEHVDGHLYRQMWFSFFAFSSGTLFKEGIIIKLSVQGQPIILRREDSQLRKYRLSKLNIK